MKQDRLALLGNLLSMLIFGTIGIVRHYMALPSGVIAFFRGVIGSLFLLAVMALTKKKGGTDGIRKNLVRLILSGGILGFNWILLFEAYNYAGVAVATLCYYLAPTFIILASPIFFRERLTPVRIVCAALSLLGMVMVSGVFGGGGEGSNGTLGILLGLAAALLYASVVLLNKSIHGVRPLTRSTAQLIISAAVLLPYLVVRGEFAMIDTASPAFPRSVILLLVAGVVHTGIAYALYFASLEKLKAQTAALFSYVDPVTAVILSALLLKERMDIFGILGAFLIIGAALAAELLPETERAK